MWWALWEKCVNSREQEIIEEVKIKKGISEEQLFGKEKEKSKMYVLERLEKVRERQTYARNIKIMTGGK